MQVPSTLFARINQNLESLINPFGCDDEDFELSYVIDRNLTIGLAILESTHMPPFDEPDAFHGMPVPKPLDRINESNAPSKSTPYNGSVADQDMSRTLNDPRYQLDRARRRTLLNKLTPTPQNNRLDSVIELTEAPKRG